MSIHGDPTFRKENMPVAASFVSDKRGLHAQLKPRTERPGPNGTTLLNMQSGLSVKFEEGEQGINNAELFKLMVEDFRFGLDTNGWNPNPLDPTGFWRRLKILQTKKIDIVDPSDAFVTPIGAVSSGGGPDEARKKFLALCDPTLKKLKPEELEAPLPTIREMKRAS